MILGSKFQGKNNDQLVLWAQLENNSVGSTWSASKVRSSASRVRSK